MLYTDQILTQLHNFIAMQPLKEIKLNLSVYKNQKSLYMRPSHSTKNIPQIDFKCSRCVVDDLSNKSLTLLCHYMEYHENYI